MGVGLTSKASFFQHYPAIRCISKEHAFGEKQAKSWEGEEV
jgi:hypothetical protein